MPKGSQLNLRLNNPPSFRNPKSVLVVGLPAVEAAQLPPLRAVNAEEIFCLEKSPLVLPVDGAPLVFSTEIAHDFVLRIKGKNGSVIDLPATPDADARRICGRRAFASGRRVGFGRERDASRKLGIRFFRWAGFPFAKCPFGSVECVPEDHGALILGRADTLHLHSECAVCVDEVTVQDDQHKDLKITWKAVKPDELEIQVPLKDETSGSLKLK